MYILRARDEGGQHQLTAFVYAVSGEVSGRI